MLISVFSCAAIPCGTVFLFSTVENLRFFHATHFRPPSTSAAALLLLATPALTQNTRGRLECASNSANGTTNYSGGRMGARRGV